MDKKIFLGGTCADTTWRDEIIPKLKKSFYDPRVKEWNEEIKQKEILERETSDYCLYVLTPKMKGIYSVAEIVDDSNKRPNKTVFCYLEKDGEKEFDNFNKKGLKAVGEMIERNGAKWCKDLNEVVEYLNK